MHIDWFVFFAQIFNFLILVYLLKRFLYGRIIAAMDEREQKIADQFQEAERIKKKAQVISDEYEKKKQSLNEKYDEMLNQSVKEVEERRKGLIEKAREEVEQIRVKWQETISRGKESFLNELRNLAGKNVYSTVRKILKDMSDVELEESIIKVFLKRIEQMKEDDLIHLKDSINKAEKGIIIRSSFLITPAYKTKIETLLKQYSTGMLDVKNISYEINDEIISGIELIAHGNKLAWSLSDYLESFEESFSYAIQEEVKQRG